MPAFKPLMMIFCGAILLCAPVLWFALLYAPESLRRRISRIHRIHQWRQRLRLAHPRHLIRWALISISLLLLSACGTAPLPAQTRRPVPAALLIPPRPPKLLAPRVPDSPSATLGPTTWPTPRAAPKTAADTRP